MTKGYTAKLVTSLEAAKNNIKAYEHFVERDESHVLVDRLSKHRVWYAIDEGEGWRFGNSKIIGYADLTPEDYLSEDHDGRQTETVLQQWFEQVGPGAPRFEGA